MTASLWIAGAGLTALLFAVLYSAGQKIDRILAEERATTFESELRAARAGAVECEVALAHVRVQHARCQATRDFETHVDKALEAAQVTPDLRRVK